MMTLTKFTQGLGSRLTTVEQYGDWEDVFALNLDQKFALNNCKEILECIDVVIRYEEYLIQN